MKHHIFSANDAVVKIKDVSIIYSSITRSVDYSGRRAAVGKKRTRRVFFYTCVSVPMMSH